VTQNQNLPALKKPATKVLWEIAWLCLFISLIACLSATVRGTAIIFTLRGQALVFRQVNPAVGAAHHILCSAGDILSGRLPARGLEQQIYQRNNNNNKDQTTHFIKLRRKQIIFILLKLFPEPGFP
jgi:hypothetical protein